MKVSTKPLAAVVSLLATLLILRIASIFLWPLLGVLVVLTFLILIFKILFKDRFY